MNRLKVIQIWPWSGPGACSRKGQKTRNNHNEAYDSGENCSIDEVKSRTQGEAFGLRGHDVDEIIGALDRFTYAGTP